MALLFMATVGGLFSAALGAIKLPTALSENSLNLLQDGIDRICNVTSLSEILVVNDDSPESDGSGLLLPFVSWHRPVTIINSSYTTRQPEGKPCIVGFFTSSATSKIARKYLGLYTMWIAVLPEDLIDHMRRATAELLKCVMYYYIYDRTTLEGAWSVEQNGQRFRALDLTGPAVTGEGDLMGQQLTFLCVSADRDTTFDVEIGETIAKRHNATFLLSMNLGQCSDFMYSPMYGSILGKLVALPEMFYMCVLVPKSAQKSIFSTLLDPFDSYTWLAVVLVVGFVSIVLSVFGESYRRHNFLVIALELLMIAINGPTHTFEGRFELRIVGLFMVMGIVLTSCYQSLVISFMSAARFDPNLDTLEQINDTCQFQWNLHLRSLGFKFKHEFNFFREVDSPELMWQDKVCTLVPCHDLIMEQSYITRSELDGMEDFNRYFRFAKARLRPSAVMYLVFHGTPMRNLIERYSMAFIEAHLYYYPMLRAGKKENAFGSEGPHEGPNVVATSADDLLIVWIIYLLGCLLSGALFVLEVLAVCIPRMWRFFRGKVGKKSIW
ncbi:uncharacterized protein LOC131207733 [Anopheles bellator]|uniref:uncharacterized protein LOC131207733 n=1 Tax=Anopheles bellator TaxID=139047 RepID=UPI0026473663|nr:uncharacterized protein LOC131207733 [Anopheles bellator]